MKLIQTYKDSFDGLHAKVWQFALMMFINRIGTLIFAFLTLYTTQELGFSASKGGMVAAAFGVGGLVGAYLGGVLTDKIGYYRVMRMSLFAAAFFFFIAQFFHDFYALCIVLFFGSLAADAIRPALYSGLSYVTDETTRTRAISLMRMSFNLGIAIGPAVAGLFIGVVGYRSIFIIDGATCFAAGIFFIALMTDHQTKNVEDKAEAETVKKSPYTDFSFLIFVMSNIIMLIAFFQIVSTVPLYIKEGLGLTETAVGLFFTANGLLIFLFEMPIIKYTEDKEYSHFRLMIVGGAMMGAGLLSLVFPPIYFLPIILYTLLASFGEIINFPFIMTISMERAKGVNVGAYTGISTMAFSIAIILSPILGTYIYEHYGFDILFIAMGSINMIGVAGYFLAEKLMTSTD